MDMRSYMLEVVQHLARRIDGITDVDQKRQMRWHFRLAFHSMVRKANITKGEYEELMLYVDEMLPF